MGLKRKMVEYKLTLIIQRSNKLKRGLLVCEKLLSNIVGMKSYSMMARILCLDLTSVLQVSAYV